MRVAIASDHAGFKIKQVVLRTVVNMGHDAIDLGTYNEEPVDYPEFADALGHDIQIGAAHRGILVCGSGIGACIAANKIRGVYASICHDTYSARQGVEHDDMNVLCLGGRVIGPALAEELVKAFLSAQFTNEERHRRRVGKIKEIELREASSS